MQLILGCDPLLMPLTGIGNYTKQLGNALNGHDEVATVKLFAHGTFFSEKLLSRNVGDVDETGTIATPGLLSILRSKLSKSQWVVKIYQWVSPVIMGRRLKPYADHIYHSPNFTLPPFKGKKVVTIHDLSTLRYPQFHPPARVDFLNQALGKVVEQADHIITDSEFVKSEVVRLMGADPAKITAIPLGADAEFAPRSEAQCQTVLAGHQLQYKQFFLFVSTLEPRKHLSNLLVAFAEYRKTNPQGMPLVMVGHEGWHSGDIHQQVMVLEGKGWVKYLGYAPQSEVLKLYSGARALLFPSIYEGFGLPVLEAMQSGIPVMTCKDSAMSEITLNHAALTDKDNTTQMTQLITRLADDDEWVAQLSSAGLARAKDFSWDKCVEQTLAVYRRL
ncbi:MAG: glycosyltransferase family 4 protein [Psychrosphaera sp.]|nr:glycosyltransferase family 4 protein [Psychrosphaera sp.]